DPSGSVFAIDWYDQNQCHSPNPDVHDKTLGRIFKITHKDDKWVQVDLSKASDIDLVNYQLHTNEWYVRQARTILQERGANPEVHEALRKILETHPDVTRKLRALWTLHVTNGLKENELAQLLSHSDEYIRSWAIQLLTEVKSVQQSTMEKFESMAKSDDSALVRLYLVSGMLRLEPNKRWKVLESLVQRPEDINDHNLPLMLWYAAEPLAEVNAQRMLQMAEKAKSPSFLKYAIQRVGALNTPKSSTLLQDLGKRLNEKNTEESHMAQAAIDSILIK
ncbi:MAG: HEAT repeat domain-containing protein, partial [Maribacter sp.]|nr:HEAT repeat domain-containing protein [Maribacter sp.]